MPVRRSSVHRDAEADRRDLLVDRRASLARRRRRSSPSAPPGRARDARRRTRWRTARSGPTTPARSLVPPRSTPMTQPLRRPPTSGLPPYPTAHGRREARVQGLPQPPAAASRSATATTRWRELRARASGRRPRRTTRSTAPAARAARRRCPSPRRPSASRSPARAGADHRRPRPALGRSLALVGWVLALGACSSWSPPRSSAATSPTRSARSSSDGPYPLTGANTILVLGSDARPSDLAEPGCDGGPSRSDSIMLLRIGGGANASLSIPRDTVVDIPGHGRNKINAAYAFGGPRARDQDRQGATSASTSTTSSRSASRTSRS